MNLFKDIVIRLKEKWRVNAGQHRTFNKKKTLYCSLIFENEKVEHYDPTVDSVYTNVWRKMIVIMTSEMDIW